MNGMDDQRMNEMRRLWQNGNITPPKILFAFDNAKERYIVLKDNSTIFRIMNSKGKVYMVANFRCRIEGNGTYYVCDDPLHIVSCRGYTNELDKYANSVILKYVKSLQ